MIIAGVSDRIGHRFPFALLGSSIGLAGFILLFVVHNDTRIQYAGLFLAATGIYTAMPMVLCWCGMNGRQCYQIMRSFPLI